MAYTETLPDDVIDQVASEIGTKAGPFLAETIQAEQTLELRETFPVWTLGADAVTKPDMDLSQLAEDTGEWHHQIKIDEKPEVFARSRPHGPNAGDWHVQKVFRSQIAERIDEAIDYVDRNVQGNPVVRLLILAAWHLHAFWLVEDGTSQILVADMPSSYTRLQYGKLYTSREFLETLAQEEYIEGIQGIRFQ